MILVIVESPGKVKKLKGYLGQEYQVRASVGHIRDLPVKGLGVQLDGGTIKLEFQVPTDKRNVVADLRAAAGKAAQILLATDPDREGEAIAWHIRETVGGGRERYRRIAFNAITKRDVQQAVRQPRNLDRPLIEAQLARRVLDRLVGYKVSPVLWRSVGSGTSAGRVQSVALRLVVEREREIRNFVPTVYWALTAWLRKPEQPIFPALLVKLDGQDVGMTISTEQAARALVEEFERGEWIVANVDKRDRERRALPPFITASLQQAASAVLRMSPKQTMQIAQKLYEEGLITYMRTDSPAIADEALAAARSYISSNFPPEYLPNQPNKFAARGDAQEAHECIRPTDVTALPGGLSRTLPPDQAKLYDLIWRRFVASQMTPARFHAAVVDIVNGRGLFRAKGEDRVFDGWMCLIELAPDKTRSKDSPAEESEVTDEAPASDVAVLEALAPGDKLDLNRLETAEKSTRPPARYTEASLIKALEREGIGRPSTYAQIMTNIRERGYIEVIKRLLHATELGERIVDALIAQFPEFWMEVPFTREMETALDQVAAGKLDWQKMVLDFDARLTTAISSRPVRRAPVQGNATPPPPLSPPRRTARPTSDTASTAAAAKQPPRRAPARPRKPRGSAPEPTPASKERLIPETPPAISGEGSPPTSGSPARPCPKCGKELVVRDGRYGKFIACTGFPGCRYTESVVEGDVAELAAAHQNETCPECGGPMVVRRGQKVFFLSCANYPDCRGIKFLDSGGAQQTGGGRRPSSPSRAGRGRSSKTNRGPRKR